ncbi:MAG: gamma-glutamyltransferase family protein [Acidobacteria bacterium]|nr:MAG: gamma-glutamyltransferase family protein [Acidobacteriota bacterium]REJ98200.1 MAG: gamma-glutamyltransferase family protein [Acidobacteriota bacterium]REK16944.1 MAG: gamma-glutamyltransferase family protein [Acidobacteriota bacterium]REK42854.1 MAG: gamma-glutamyltransferase family protein [Acidobacteriota bacterium]
MKLLRPITLIILVAMTFNEPLNAQRTAKPVLHGRHWVAITGKPLAATAGAMMFQKGGNAVDAACAMIGATSTMWDVLSWGGETQALIYNPKTKKVIGVNALGVAPTGATVEYYASKGFKSYPPEHGALSAVTPGTPGGIFAMLAEYGTLSLKDVLEPSIQMAEGYPMEEDTAGRIEREKDKLKKWKYSRDVMLPNKGKEREAPVAGEIFRQPDLAETLKKLVEAEANALKNGKSRKEAIYAAHERFYKGDIAREFVRGTQEEGGLITMEDLAGWKVKFEEPVKTSYKGIDVYKLTHWTQGPVMLQALNILENFDLKSMGYNSSKYIHTLYQTMNLAYADRDFYYGDPAFPPAEPIQGLLSKDYAKARLKEMDPDDNDPDVKPGDPYPFQGETNPFNDLLRNWGTKTPGEGEVAEARFLESFYAGTTTVQAADKEGWIVSVTPSGGWVPAVIAGRTGIGLSQRAQSFDLDRRNNPFNVIEPGKQPRVTLTPSLAIKDGKPFLSFSVQGGDGQDQNLLQFFLNVVEFGMNVQEAVEAANINSYQMKSSFGDHESDPGRLLLADSVPDWIRRELIRKGYRLRFQERTSGPINAIFFDREHGTMWGGSSHHGDDYGIAW